MVSEERIVLEQEHFQFYIEKTESGGVRLLRCCGDCPAITIPERLGGAFVEEIAEYCFADSARAQDIPGQKEEFRILAGEYLQEVRLPGTVRRLGSLAFYNCKNLRELGFGAALTEVGSDVFMNCRALQSFRVAADMRQMTGLKQLLAQRMCSVDVCFTDGQRVSGRLYYPEYEEYHDEIGPAHIFAMSIRGEGFRARQCFREGVIELHGYDEIFEQACAEESEETLCRLAWYRLAYPVELGSGPGEDYREYLREHQQTLAELLVEEKDVEALKQFASDGTFSGEGLECAAFLAAQKEWVQGAAVILKLQTQQLSANSTEDRYTFEEW